VNSLLYLLLAVIVAIVGYVLVERLTEDDAFALVTGLLLLVAGVIAATGYRPRR
jgi:positive regulator of sigma E activity